MGGGGAEDPDHDVELLWREEEQEPRTGLSTGRIVRAAIDLADEEGLDGLSMRKIADRLGFTTMSLYRHVPGRDQLVALMLDAAQGQAPPPRAARGDWRARLEACARRAWDLRRRHPWVAEVRGSRHLPGPNGVAAYEDMLSAVADTGLPAAQMIAAVNLVARFVHAEAQTLVETARQERRSGVSERDWWGARDELYQRLDRYPTLTALWEAGGYDAPEDSFEFGLARVLDGIDMLIAHQRDETRDETCPMCGKSVEQPPSGRPRVYCSRACQQRAYRRRQDG
ncbi:TetR/AcrR family transcriptional regulator C-terminal domain-containing protein [Actinophytocola xanthii]|uniref:TetR family transcriptional regulator n=1 Tax=Actinophytocola xanthii TaxID=1912961 RepID=A0A1Q8CKW8_9PSEU|nr:TetR/AcrR family transcriptional regulator C-terminal domain-containing protein [Actinophytocola xanthii]OLF14995.1 TetR family transcriptional regulator [Actinophytocola xanthii]